ncbi:family 78 glycoside hydrolase catalytic domain [Streptomyces sp. NPDC050560]|uniref:alpha-L-rhamnosidase n=1 Tax=Streptomyces sp. NPDC050560 TaxID=3365630 RepID=UPI0037A8FFC3
MTQDTSGADATGNAVEPYALAVEQRERPREVDDREPRFSWRLRSRRRGAAPAAFRVEVHESAPGHAPVWDTGQLPYPAEVFVPYGGATLRPAATYRWRVTVWDDTGAAAEAESWFETGLRGLDGFDGAAWIGADPLLAPEAGPPTVSDRSRATSSLAGPRLLRRAFRLDEAPRRARLFATARGLYELHLNGVRVGDEELAPGWTEYALRTLYRGHDVTGLLAAGPNTLGAVLGDGWFCGYVGFDALRGGRHYGAAPRLAAWLVLDMPDGGRTVLTTDGRWEERPGDTQYADLLMGEHVDGAARRALSGWAAPEGGVGGFRPVLVADRDLSTVRAETGPPVRVLREVAPVGVSSLGPGQLVVDFGENLVGRVRLTVRGAGAGDTVTLRHAEVLEGGEPYTENLRRAEATDRYTARGGGPEVFEPRFTVHGFRYAEVSGYPGDLDPADITARVLGSDTPEAGEFACSDALVGRLQGNIVRGQRGNFLSVPTDCPQRDERLGWLADAQIFAPTASRNRDVSAFFARWLPDVLHGQDEDGAFRDVAPLLSTYREAAPAWGDAGVIIPWHLYRAYGDLRALECCFPAMAAWVEHIHRHNPDLLWTRRTGNNYGDWLQVDAETRKDVLATAYFAHSCDLVARAAEVLGRAGDAERFHALRGRVAAAFREAYVDGRGRVAGETQTGYLVALAFGLLTEELAGRAAARLAADVEARGNRLTTGFAGVALLCPVLTECGRADLAYALLHQTAYPSWGFSLLHGATTIWERWDGWTPEGGFQAPEMNSFNHYSLGSVGDWLYGRVAGLDQDPASSAYRRLLLRPTPGGLLTSASARQETPRGEAACGWSLADGTLTVEVRVPPGSEATLELPTDETESVHEGGLPWAAAGGVAGLGTYPGGIRVALRSGRYAFTARYAAPGANDVA